MSSDNKAKKKENWFSRLSRNLFKKTPSESSQSEPSGIASNPTQAIPESHSLNAQQAQDFIQQKFLGELTKFKTNLVSELAKSSSTELNPKNDIKLPQKEDEFDISRFNKPYTGVNIVSPVMRPHPTGSGFDPHIQAKSTSLNTDPSQPKSVMEMRKNFLNELVRLKKVINETEVESEVDEQAKNLLSKKLSEELAQFKKNIKDTPTEEEKKILADGDWDVW